MTMDPRQSQYLRAKKGEEDYSQINPIDDKFPKITCSKQWSNYKNPRIVRASRAFGGKDRHTKVCTVKGLRDRRIRLSAPTAIQLYDLQDRLGLNQPSKVVDWLLEATKEEIDKLPPLPMIPQFHQPNDPLLIPSSVHNRSLLYNKDLPVDHNVSKSNQDWGFGGFQVHNNLFPSSNYQGNLPHCNVQSWDHHCPNLTLSQYGGEFSLSSSQIIDDYHQLNTHVNMANAVMVPSFSSYNIITSSMETNNNVVPATLHYWISNSSMSSTLGLNVNCRIVNSQVNDSDEK